MESPARLAVIDHVEIEAPTAARSQVQWFYGEFLRLRQLLADPDENRLCFKSERYELRISFTDQPVIVSNDCRLHLEVRSLQDAACELEEARHEFEWYRGMRGTDRALITLDPAGNRVELRRLWLGNAF